MFAAVRPILFLLTTAAVYVHADPNPNNPGPGDVFVEGKSCAIGWDADPTGVWKTMHVDLMTGDNFNMVFLKTVAIIDGTNPSKHTFSFKCPRVTPHSPIYFYQFSSPSTSNKTWTGRFTITDSPKDIVPPSQSTQPDGQKIPWGTGALVNGSSSVSSVSSATASTSGTPRSDVPSAASSTPSTMTSYSETPDLSVVYVTSSVSVTPSSVSITRANGATATLAVSNIVFLAELALGLAALGFTVMF